MQISTTKFGVIEVNEQSIFNFVEPIIGYEDLSEYIIVQHDEDTPFTWLQSVQDPDLSFPVTTAGYFNIEYNFEISDEDAAKIELTSPEELIVLNIATIPSDNPQNATINLLAPVIMNAKNKMAMQIILGNSTYSTRERLFPEQTLAQSKAGEN